MAYCGIMKARAYFRTSIIRRISYRIKERQWTIFIWGGNTDKVVAGIRHLSGKSPLLPKWSFGFVQSKERYESQEEVVNVVKNTAN